MQAIVDLLFQTTPRFLSEGKPPPGSTPPWPASFTPPPASSARGTRDGARGAPIGHVSTHPPLRQRGEPLAPQVQPNIGLRWGESRTHRTWLVSRIIGVYSLSRKW